MKLFYKGIFRGIILLVLVGIALSNARAEAQDEVRVTSDITYKTGAVLTGDENKLCKLDLYVPAGAKNLPCLVWFHGGGLTGGDKATRATSALCRGLASEGFVVASANYRLNPGVKFPAYVEDAAAAVNWVWRNAGVNGGDAGRIFVGGHSAGAYLTALVGTDPRYLKAYDLSLENIAGLIPLSGQMSTHFTIMVERGLPETTLAVDEAAPVHYARSGTPPMLLMYGEKDMPLRAEENEYFAAALRVAGNPRVRVLRMAGRDHGGMIGKMAAAGDPVRREIVAFMQSAAK